MSPTHVGDQRVTVIRASRLLVSRKHNIPGSRNALYRNGERKTKERLKSDKQQMCELSSTAVQLSSVRSMERGQAAIFVLQAVKQHCGLQVLHKTARKV